MGYSQGLQPFKNMPRCSRSRIISIVLSRYVKWLFPMASMMEQKAVSRDVSNGLSEKRRSKVHNQCRHSDAHYIAPLAPFRGRACCKRYALKEHLMEEWISEHWLALYGAIVGTLALFLNVSRFIHAVKKDSVKLKIKVEDHPQKSENIKMITEPASDKDWEVPKIVKTHTLIVRNIGNVDAHIEDAWITCKKGDKHKVLV